LKNLRYTKIKILLQNTNNLYNLYKYNVPSEATTSSLQHYYGIYYKEKKDYEQMKKYYLMAIDKGSASAMFNLGYYYEKQKDYDLMKKYYMGTKGQNDTYPLARVRLGEYYENIEKDYEKMEIYYLEAAGQGNFYAMDNLGYYYKKQKDYGQMEKYYLMMLDKGHMKSMYELTDYYENIEKDFDKSVKCCIKYNNIELLKDNNYDLMQKCDNIELLKIYYKYDTITFMRDEIIDIINNIFDNKNEYYDIENDADFIKIFKSIVFLDDVSFGTKLLQKYIN
jgi:TPR repeat protein